MIQRIQSIFLLVTAVLLIIFLFVPIWENTNKTTEKNGKITEGKVILTAFNVKYSGVEKIGKNRIQLHRGAERIK
jgi:ABC-type Zn uptake system ZnuABC Zn-binding protein ZnuA